MGEEVYKYLQDIQRLPMQRVHVRYEWQDKGCIWYIRWSRVDTSDNPKIPQFIIYILEQF